MECPEMEQDKKYIHFNLLFVFFHNVSTNVEKRKLQSREGKKTGENQN
jgi:hypothetical protein